MMEIYETALPISSGAASCHSYCGLCMNTSYSRIPFNFHLKYRKTQFSGYMGSISNSRILQNYMRMHGDAIGSSSFYGNTECICPRLLRCQCQLYNRIIGMSINDSNGEWFKEPINKTSQIHDALSGQRGLGFGAFQRLKHKRGDSKLNNDKSSMVGAAKHSMNKKRGTSVEDEAWRLSQESVVYYCGNPVGTIAAMDSSDASVLSYDHVFIRDFIPSGVAFLLQGEYDIVRNFILHTLQLQSWERTMDCYSPGQGLMPARFKVRTVPLDGDDSATEEVLVLILERLQ